MLREINNINKLSSFDFEFLLSAYADDTTFFYQPRICNHHSTTFLMLISVFWTKIKRIKMRNNWYQSQEERCYSTLWVQKCFSVE